jgi:hypothetical protein
MAVHKSNDEFNTDGIDIISKDWDNLIILDGCRYDVFAKINPYDESKLTKQISRGSSTKEFLRGNIKGRHLPEVIYITANPQYAKNYDGSNFHSTHNLFKSESWNKNSRTVLPTTFVEKSLSIYEQTENKRIIFHLIQPHNPFIGDFGRQVINDSKLSFWPRVRSGNIDHSDNDLYAAYVENTVLVVKKLEKLLKNIQGKTIITSDHGQLIGDRLRPFPVKEYGHPSGVYTPKLVEVPWLAVNSGERREITPGSTSESSTISEKELNRRLKSLGYKTS